MWKFEQNLATGAYTREALRDEFLQAISTQTQYGTTGIIQVNETVLERMMVKYSEQLVYQPINEIRYWYAYSSGDWFPFELNKDGFVFVVDDDGSVFVATEHFSAELIAEAGHILRQIADDLYTVRSQLAEKSCFLRAESAGSILSCYRGCGLSRTKMIQLPQNVLPANCASIITAA